MSRRQHYQRVVIDDSSDDDDRTNFNNVANDMREGSSESDENMDTSIRDVSHLMETLSFTRRNNCGHRMERADDELTNADEDTYIEDSFLVKDSSHSDSRKSSSWDYENTSSYTSKHSGKSFKQKSAEFSSFFKSDQSDGSVDDEKVATLLELYPELKENVDIKHNKSISTIQKLNHGTPEYDDDSDEKFEKYLEKVKTQSSASKTYGAEDLERFVVSSSESVDEYSSESEFDGSDDNEQPTVPTLKSHLDWDNRKQENTTQLRLPATEKKRKRKELTNLLLGSRSAPNLQKQDHRDGDELFLLALSPNGPVQPDAHKFTTTKFSLIRKDLAQKLFAIYRRRCFEDKLDPNMVFEWNARLRRTAGRCRCKTNGTASIELSTKVCDTPERLRDTMLHELCHAAVWVIDRIPKGGHGPAWKYWVYRCREVFPFLPLIERCHNYKVDAKFLYICNRCGQTIKRHSKSLDVNRKICGICEGHFILHNRGGKQVSIGPFALFVKENYGREKKPGLQHVEIMKILSQRFKEEKGMVLASDPETEDIDAKV